MLNKHLVDHQSCYRKMFRARKVVFFCGSAISIFSPSNTISGWEIRKGLSGRFNTLLKQFKLTDCAIDDFFDLPFETIMDIGFYVMGEKPNPKNLSKLKNYFSKISPNKIHFLIAFFLYFHRDAVVVTTNYDDGIENAYQFIVDNLGPSKYPIEVYPIKDLRQIKKRCSHAIYKIHGCAIRDTAKELVFTTRQETNIFTPKLLGVFEKIFNNSTAVFMGYSFSEPDCFEVLFNLNNLKVIWFCKSIDEVRQNPRITFLLENAKEYDLVEDLTDILMNSFPVMVPFKEIRANKNQIVNKVESSILVDGKKKQNQIRKIVGLKKFSINFQNINKEKFLRGLITGFLQLRNYEAVSDFLDKYKKLKNSNQYFYYFSLASITRDLNNDWKIPVEYFRMAQLTNDNSMEDIFSARIEELGLHTLLNQNNIDGLIQAEKEMRLVGSEINTFAQSQGRQSDVELVALTGRLKKNQVQNLLYQKDLSLQGLNYAIDLIDQAIDDLNLSRQIHPRVESERFKSRALFRKYKISNNKQDLVEAIYLSKKTVFLFKLLGSKMGSINALRQYIHYLIEKEDFDEARKQLLVLENEMGVSEDRLSYQKTLLLYAILYFKTIKIFPLLAIFIKIIILSLRFPWNKEKAPMKFLEVCKWFLKFIRGSAG